MHPLPQHLTDLLAMALLYPSVGPPSLAMYMIRKIADGPPPDPHQAVTWVEFVRSQETKVRVPRSMGSCAVCVLACGSVCFPHQLGRGLSGGAKHCRELVHRKGRQHECATRRCGRSIDPQVRVQHAPAENAADFHHATPSNGAGGHVQDGSIANAPKQALRNMAYKALAAQPFATDCFIGLPGSDTEPATPAGASAVAEILEHVPLRVRAYEQFSSIENYVI